MTTTSDPVLVARSRVGVASRRLVRDRDPERLASARRNLTFALAERHIHEALEATPPLTDEQRGQLADMLLEGKRV
jgi:hypothetical protein